MVKLIWPVPLAWKHASTITQYGMYDFLIYYWIYRLYKQLDEAKLLAPRYYERYRKMPKPEVFHEYFMLFETSESVTNNAVFEKKIRLGNSEEQTYLYMNEHAPKFESYDEFIKYCFEQGNNER